MPQIPDRNQLGSEELPEASMVGPFGGVQSELSPTQIEDLGFSNSDNIIFRLGRGSLRPGYTTLPTLPGGEKIVGTKNFFNVNGTLIQAVMTPTKLYNYAAGVFTEITGPGFTGSATSLFSADVLNYKLCFSQGADKIWIWDGSSATYASASASAPRARFLAEIGLHLFGVDPTTPQRYYWSGIGDPTDWTGLTSGLNDIVNNAGPINGMLKLGQYGFGFHQLGIQQIVPTGNGLAPFAFGDIISTPQSVAAPYTLAKYVDQGSDLAVYLGIDNVYVFNGTSIESIGDRPLDGRRRVGARSAILQDVLSAGTQDLVGTVTYQIAGNAFRAYWLLIPPNRAWVYNFDEGNWTRFIYSQTDTLRLFAPFSNSKVIRIMDLVGVIAAQSWTPATLNVNNPFLGFLLAFDSGVSGYVDFTNQSELAGNFVSGQCTFQDPRHKHTVKKFRLRFVDKGSATITLSLTNEGGRTETHTFTIGNGSGQEISFVQGFNITGLRFIWSVSVPAGTAGDFVEFASIYDIGGEQRCGVLEN